LQDNKSLCFEVKNMSEKRRTDISFEVVRDLYLDDFQILTSSTNRLSGTNYIINRIYALEKQVSILEQDTRLLF